MAVPKRKQSHSRASKRRAQHKIYAAGAERVPSLRESATRAPGVPGVRHLRMAVRCSQPEATSTSTASSGRNLLERSSQPTVAVDANGADLGPAEVAAGAAIAAEQGVRVILFGPRAEIGPPPDGVEVVDAPLSIAKSADPARAVRMQQGRIDRAGRRALSPTVTLRRSFAPGERARRSRPASSTSSAPAAFTDLRSRCRCPRRRARCR